MPSWKSHVEEASRCYKPLGVVWVLFWTAFLCVMWFIFFTVPLLLPWLYLYAAIHCDDHYDEVEED